MKPTAHLGDCVEVLAAMEPETFDSVVCDPPYHLTAGKKGGSGEASVNLRSPAGRSMVTTGFMGKEWDGGDVAFRSETWTAVYRVLKPGAYLVAFGGTRTSHRMACAIEDAGFEIRDSLMWLYASGFPKSLDVSKAIDKAAGAEREVVGLRRAGITPKGNLCCHGVTETEKQRPVTAPATEAARQWQGWGTALKPSHEIIICAQKSYDMRQLSGILALKLMEAICQLPSHAKGADESSLLNRSVFGEGFGSAQWDAVVGCSTPDDLFALMGTLPSGSAIPSSLSIALSWLDTLGAILSDGNTFTTETESSLTTDLRTLKSLLSKNTAESIIQAATEPSGTVSNASLAARIFSAVASRLQIIRELSALGPATSKDEESGLRPNREPIILARKPLAEKTVAANVLKHGVGALNVDGCRVGETGGSTQPSGMDRLNAANARQGYRPASYQKGEPPPPATAGRWPPNILHDGSPEVLEAFARFGVRPGFNSGGRRDGLSTSRNSMAGPLGNRGESTLKNDSGTAARFFPELGFHYSGKATKADRAGSKHPTVKPQSLMRWLCRLVTPPGGHVLDPFAGSGSTLQAAHREGFRATGIELTPEHFEDIQRRLRLLEAFDDGLFAGMGECA